MKRSTRILYRLRVLHALGLARTWYWRYLRTRRAYARHIRLAEWQWSGKQLPRDEVDHLVDELKGHVPW
jgi:predicted DNA-binding transcriptional regulator AlpA